TYSCNRALFSRPSERLAALVKRIVTSLAPAAFSVARTGSATAEPPRVSVKNPVHLSEQLRTTCTPDLSAPFRPSMSADTAEVAIASGAGGITVIGQPLGAGPGEETQRSASSFTPSPSE